jgi:hypothetical protein
MIRIPQDRVIWSAAALESQLTRIRDRRKSPALGVLGRELIALLHQRLRLFS